MIYSGEDELICDLAETYNILDYKALPVKLLGVLSCGLSSNSRIMRKMHGEKFTSEEMLTAAMVDRLSLLVYANTKDAAKGRNKPKMLIDEMQKEPQGKKEDVVKFSSADEFNAARERIIKGG